MNKIVVFAPPAHGHVNPSLPVVRELVRRGDQVIYYNHEDFREKIEGTGCTFRPYPPTDMSAAKITEILRGGNLAAVINLIMKSTEILLPFSIEELEREKPDMVIIDSIAVWGRMAATIQQLPTVAFMAFFLMYGTEEEKRLPINLRHILQWLPEIPGTVIPFIRIIFKYGFRMLPPFKSFLPLRGDNNLFFTSKEFHPHSPLLNDSFHFVGPSISDTTPDTHFIPSENTDDVIYIALGTIHGRRDFFLQCLETFADYPAHFILSVGNEIDPHSLGIIPDNFSVHKHVPQLEILQRVKAFISHAGMNSIHEGLYFSVPMLLIPQQFEQLFGARCVANQGAGLFLDHHTRFKQFTNQELRDSLDKLLGDSCYKDNADKISLSLKKTGGYNQAADKIQQLILQNQG